MAMTMNTTDDFDHPDADAQDCGRKQSNHVIARSSLLFRLVFWIAVIVVAASQAQAFVVVTPSSSPHWTKLSNKSFQHRSIVFAQHNDEHETSQHASNFAHSDIEWRLRPPEGTSRFNRLKVKLGAQILRLDCKLKGERLPSVLCPRGGRALLEAYYKEPGRRKKKIARFGFTTARGPSSAEIDTTIKETYNINPPPLSATIAAIIYMFVEPEYRNRDVGSLALEVISAIQYVQAVDFTILVADDNGSGGLVRWYEDHGYARAPLLQSMLGSPNEENGIAMISPVKIKPGFFDQCVIKWW